MLRYWCSRPVSFRARPGVCCGHSEMLFAGLLDKLSRATPKDKLAMNVAPLPLNSSRYISDIFVVWRIFKTPLPLLRPVVISFSFRILYNFTDLFYSGNFKYYFIFSPNAFGSSHELGFMFFLSFFCISTTFRRVFLKVSSRHSIRDLIISKDFIRRILII